MACDEMALRKGLFYDDTRDVVHGFVDYESGRTTGEVADHALQVVINWLRKPLKEAVATYFTRNTCPSKVLKVLICENIASLQRLGIIVKVYVCDQGSTNRSAVRALIEESGGTADNSLIVNGVKVFAFLINLTR